MYHAVLERYVQLITRNGVTQGIFPEGGLTRDGKLRPPKIGLLDYAKLAGFRRYMILINLILGALLTTPEVLTQVAMFIPLQFLYELTIWIAWYWEQPDRALARRRLVMAIIGFILLCVLGYYAYRYGWPWLLAKLKPAG